MSREVEYNYLKCDCGCYFEVQAFILRGFKDNEDISCPKCNKFVATIRADVGYETKILSEEELLDIHVNQKIDLAVFRHSEGINCVLCHSNTTSFVLSLEEIDADSIACCESCYESNDIKNENNRLFILEED
ncbi:hypothetical protein [Paenibacillus odorifer]|uniref:hypothetical protein n=1 Tax=Paenibacillus TaxID=44249 RepID=UPI00096EC21E|nr:hypothetical protein [Paenibacillus odorifer]OME37860.1 hypothetical protein BSK46_14110 [Paenibacillus odorifer]OME42754.1 hypothetical protein BSK58_11440 [Paenibacillus odorifer]